MPYEIVERLVEIVENVTDSSDTALSVPFTGFTQVPQATPAQNWFLPLQRRMTTQVSGGNRFIETFIYDMRFYLTPIATKSAMQNRVEIDFYSDVMRRNFHARPQLMLNDDDSTRLPNIVGNTAYIVTSGLATPLLWPLGLPPDRGGTIWWGFIGQLTVDWRELNQNLVI